MARPLAFAATRNAMIFAAEELAALPGHSPEFLDLVTPALAAAFAEIHEGRTIADRVKSVLKRSLASGRAEMAHVTRDPRMADVRCKDG